MTIDIHKVITGNPITKNLMKPWGSNKEKTIFNKCTGPGNNLKQQLDFNPYTGEIYKIHDQLRNIFLKFMERLKLFWIYSIYNEIY